MINKSTVFILGAGVSIPFGFPSGGLLLQILTGATSNVDNDENRSIREQHRNIIDVMKTVETERWQLEDFITKLKGSGTSSIDSWLSQNVKGFGALGKVAIAALIANAEHKSTDHDFVADDWYKWIFNKMKTDAIGHLSQNNISFITFNYDRMLEWKLGQFIENYYHHASHYEKKAAIDFISARTIHVHGSLSYDNYFDLKASIRDFPMHSVSSFNAIDRKKLLSEYGKKAISLSQSIRIIGETNSQHDPESKIAGMIQGAEKIIFLGFGYDKENINLLGLKSRVSLLMGKAYPSTYDIPIMGSAVGLETMQANAAKSLIHAGMWLGLKDEGCVKFCNSYVSLS